MTDHLEIQRINEGQDHLVIQAAHLFDKTPDTDATRRFLASDIHHLFIAFQSGSPVGFVSGVEMTHPDKGTEMFLYELGVDEPHRNQGVGTQLIQTLRDHARDRGCYAMWVLTDDDNAPALRAYSKAGGAQNASQRMLSWLL